MRQEHEIREAYQNLNRILRDEQTRVRMTKPEGMQLMSALLALEWVLGDGDDEMFARMMEVLELWARAQERMANLEAL